MKGVILAGGSGKRLWPITEVVCKQLLPVYDKPMIYYPLSTLILSGVTEVLIITSPNQKLYFENLLGNGSKLGISISYKIQLKPLGLAHGVHLAEDFVKKESFWFILGDNLFHGLDFGLQLKEQIISDGAKIFCYRMADVHGFGVANFSSDGRIESIVEKPVNSKSNWVVPGIYLFDSSVFEKFANLIPSSRNELEIVDLLNAYIREEKLSFKKLSRGNAWFDCGTAKDLLSASNYVHIVQSRQGSLVGSPEEVAFRCGLIRKEHLVKFDSSQFDSSYSSMLTDISQGTDN